MHEVVDVSDDVRTLRPRDARAEDRERLCVAPLDVRLTFARLVRPTRTRSRLSTDTSFCTEARSFAFMRVRFTCLITKTACGRRSRGSDNANDFGRQPAAAATLRSQEPWATRAVRTRSTRRSTRHASP